MRIELWEGMHAMRFGMHCMKIFKCIEEHEMRFRENYMVGISFFY